MRAQMCPTPNSDGERLFAAYLRQRRIPWEYEREVNGRNPDFSVDHPAGAFVAEVYEPELRLPKGGGWFDSYTPLRRAFDGRKARQIKAVKSAGLPYVAVVAGTNFDMPIKPIIMAGAMFGNLAVTFTLKSDIREEDIDDRTIFGGGGRVQPNQYRGVSAMALIERFNPTARKLGLAVEARLARVPQWRPDMTKRQTAEIQSAIVRLTQGAEDEFLASGSYDPWARLARLTVLHNPYAEHPLRLDVLNGHHDSQWGRIVVDGEAGYGELPAATIRNRASGGELP
jgi:hypothetical protein